MRSRAEAQVKSDSSGRADSITRRLDAELGGAAFRTDHAPSAVTGHGVCLQQDDYEGLLTLYPVCSIEMPPTPICPNAALNIGMLRTVTALLVPLCLSIATAILVECLVRPRLKSLTEQTNGGLGTSVTRLVGGGLASLRSGRINTSGSGGAGAPSAAEDDGEGVEMPRRESQGMMGGMFGKGKGKGKAPIVPVEGSGLA